MEETFAEMKEETQIKQLHLSLTNVATRLCGFKSVVLSFGSQLHL